MLVELYSTDPGFKRVKFQPGLNILVAEKTKASSATDSRNGSGKSSVVEILHFQLGMTRLTDSVLLAPELKNHEFTLRLNWPSVSRDLTVSRSLAKKSKVRLEPNVVELKTLVELAGSESIPAWVSAIGRDLFGLPEEHAPVSARMLIGLYIRRVSQHGFNEPVKTHPSQSVSVASAQVAYLLGLNWRLAGSYAALAARDGTLKKLKAAAKDPSFHLLVGSVSELRGQIASAKRRVHELQSQVETFRVVPEYELLQANADELDGKIRGLRAGDAADRANIQDLEAAFHSESEPDTRYLERAYAELGLSLPERVLRSYEEVRRFHESVLTNRRSYLEEELASTKARLELRQEERIKLGEGQAKLLHALSEGGALAALGTMQEQLSVARANLAALQNRFEMAKKLEESEADIKVDRVKLRQSLNRDLAEREAVIEEVNRLFQRFAAALYSPDRDAYIEFTALDTSLQIVPHIGGERSKGIGQMVIFCFDLTLAVIAHRNGRGPDFLVHDSHLFDGVDERQISRALVLATAVCSEEEMQYIITMNSDELAKVEGVGTPFDEYVIQPRLTDTYEDGGLFGFRFD